MPVLLSSDGLHVTRGPGPRAPVLSAEFAKFNGTTTVGTINSVASQLHSLDGDYWYAALIKAGNDGGRILELTDTGDSSPFLIVGDSVAKSRYRGRRDLFMATADETTAEDVYDDAIHLIVWETRDEGANAGLRSFVDNGAVTFYGAGTEVRSLVNWADTAEIGGRAGSTRFDGLMGWLGAGTGRATDGAVAIWAALQAGGRRALSEAFDAVAGVSLIAAYVLDGETAPDAGPAISWTDITYEVPA